MHWEYVPNSMGSQVINLKNKILFVKVLPAFDQNLQSYIYIMHYNA